MRFATLVFVAVVALVPCGCQQPDHPPEAARAAKNVYGLSITLDLRDKTGAEEFYTVDRDGLFSFGGGMNARFEKPSYTAMLAEADMQRLDAVIEQQRLLTEPLNSTNQPDNVRYELKIKRSGDSVNKTVKGDNSRVEALRAVLREFANRRLESELERQPKASGATQPATSPH